MPLPPLSKEELAILSGGNSDRGSEIVPPESSCLSPPQENNVVMPDVKNPIQRVKSSLGAMRERRVARHQPSGFGFVFADRIDYLDAARWDALCHGASAWLKRDVLRVIEEHGPENILPRYAIIFQGDTPVAALAAQVVTVNGDRLQSTEKTTAASLAKRLLKSAKTAATKKIKQRMLVGGNLLCWGFHGIAFAPGINPELVWPAVSEALYRIRRSEKLTGQTNLVMVKDITAAQTEAQAMRTFSYRALETEPNMVLEIGKSWRSYDDYLAALDSKYRSNAKSQIKKLAAAGCILERLADVAAHADRLHALYLAVQGKAAVRLVTVPATYLPNLAASLGDDFRCHVVRREGELLGFVTTLRDGETAIAYYIGFDQAAAAEGIPIYLRLLHATIGDAIEWGCRRLSLGRTALEPKAAMGAKPEPMSVWMRHRIPAINWVVRGLLDSVPHDEPPDRNPFKSSPPSA